MPKKGKPEFHEDWINPNIDPLAAAQISDAYEELAKLEEDDEEPDSKVIFDTLFEGLIPMLAFFLEGNPKRPGYAQTVGRRVIAALWAINPDYFDGASLAQLSRCEGIDCTRAWLSELAVEFGDRFGIRNRAMHNERARKRYREGAKTRIQGTDEHQSD